MSLIRKLSTIIDECKEEYQSITAGDYFAVEQIKNGENILAHSDNLKFMKYLIDNKGMEGKINLIYIDPPFFSKANYGADIKLTSEKIKNIPVIKQKAYHDMWEDGMEDYLRMVTTRLFMMKDLLAEDGSIWVHLDWHSVHYVKIIMDEIFGEKNFVNEVIWNYKSGGVSKTHFARKHDTLLFYSKSNKYYFKAQKEKSYNREFKPYRFKGVEEYQDEVGWYTMVNMKDVWQLNMVGRTSSERTGYATQKPELLVERILESCSREGDLCADFFGGSGTLAATADKMDRNWISCDMGKLSVAGKHRRLAESTKNGYILFEDAENKLDSGKLVVKTHIEKPSENQKNIIKLELVSYKPENLQQQAIDKKHFKVIENIIKEDSLKLLDYWSVDFDYDGKIFKPDLIFCKKQDNISLSCEYVADNFSNIGIHCLDIFGNSSFQIIDFKGE